MNATEVFIHRAKHGSLHRQGDEYKKFFVLKVVHGSRGNSFSFRSGL